MPISFIALYYDHLRYTSDLIVVILKSIKGKYSNDDDVINPYHEYCKNIDSVL